MCEIKEGVEVYLVSGGNVMFPNGDIYSLSDCKLTGGTLILGIGEAEDASPHIGYQKKPKKKNVGKSLIVKDMFDLGDFELKEIKTQMIEVKDEVIPEENYNDFFAGGFVIVFALLFNIFKKVSGINNELKIGSCEVRHAEAITRISKLEGKVLRKQIVDGGKFVKEKYDKSKKKKEDI